MGRHSGPLREEYCQAMSAIHDNFNILCAIDIKTTGPLPGYDSIYEVCILPIGSYMQPYDKITPFYTQIQPYRKDNINPKTRNRGEIINAMSQGMDYGMSIDAFDDWYQDLPLNLNKKIMPLAYNWPLTYAFFLDWLGFRHLNNCFDYRFRDILSMAHFVNDYADFHIRRYPFKKIDFGYMLNVSQLEYKRNKADTLENCVNIAKIYHDTLRDSIIHLPTHREPIEDDPEMISSSTQDHSESNHSE